MSIPLTDVFFFIVEYDFCVYILKLPPPPSSVQSVKFIQLKHHRHHHDLKLEIVMFIIFNFPA